MFSQSFTISPTDDYPFFLTAKRYWTEHSDKDGLTLFLMHSTGFHKECWEPTLERVFSRASSGVREAWVLDCPNHGASAALNEVTLRRPEFYCNFTCEKYAFAARHFLAHDPKFRRRRLVGIGHSLGGVSITHLHAIASEYNWASLILIDPMIVVNPSPTELELPELRSRLVRTAYERRDVWPGIEAATTYFLAHKAMSTWDPRVRMLFIKHALRPHPGSSARAIPYNGLSLACTRDEEAAMYRDADGRSVDDLDHACSSHPVHLIVAGKHDFL
ncbi:hypothetical protein BDZ89DRAFT_952353 [Hymenopellis radicata]|nr:hypothetical protein BDZ89DRAFT_952353 [Hymenopellis radicata]